MTDTIQQKMALPSTTSVFLGATFDAVNGYYSKQWSSESFEAPNQGHYYQLQPKLKEATKNFSCGPCNRSFFSNNQYKKHLDEHVQCPFPECSLSAHIKVIDQHISHQHMLINFESLQVDDEKWIADRKNRFPTLERAELRRAELMERMKRGARIGLERKTLSKTGYKSKGNFSNELSNMGYRNKGSFNNDLSKTGNRNKKDFRNDSSKSVYRSKEDISNDGHSNEVGEPNAKENIPQRSEDRNNIKRTYKSLSEKKEEHKKNSAKLDLFDSDNESKFGIPAFKGMTEFFESTGELSLFGFKSCEVLESSNLDISDDEEYDWNVSQDGKGESPCQNALGILMGSYSDSEYEADSEKQLPAVGPQNKSEVSFSRSDNCGATMAAMENESKDNDKQFTKRHRKRFHRKTSNKDTLDKPQSSQQISISKPKSIFNRPPKRRRKPTLLERLLEPDIKRERNMILQCIRFIVNENYFEKKIEEQNTECIENQNTDALMNVSKKCI